MLNKLKNSRLSRFLSEKHYMDHVVFIGVGILAAVVCCLYAILFSKLENLGVAFIHELGPWALLVSPLFLVLAFLLVRKFAPGAAGSGIPQVMICVEPQMAPLSKVLLSLKVVVIKIISSSVSIFSAAAIGREGPSLQISAALAYHVGKAARKFGIQVRPDQLLIAGASSGLAAAFNTPIGGIVYAVEELAHEHLRSFKDVLLLSVVIAGFTAQLIMGNYLYLGTPVIPPRTYEMIILVSVVSVVCGLLGSLFSKFLNRLIHWRGLQSLRTQVTLVLSVGVLLILSFLIFGERTVFSGKESINFVLFDLGQLSAVEVLSRFFSPLLSSMTGIAGGIFAPSLSAGAVIGGYVSQLYDPAFKSILGLAGMISFLTGVTHAPITSFVLVLEMTDRQSAVLPMMFAAFFGSIGGHALGGKSFYEITVENLKQKHLTESTENLK